MSELATVVIADNDPTVRRSLAGLLGDDPRLEVVGLASTGLEAAILCAGHHPSLAVVDVRMPYGGVAAIEAILEASPATIVVTYTARSDRPTRERMLAAGSRAVFVKGGAADLPGELAELWESSRTQTPR